MADLLQILRATGAKPRVTFFANGVATDLDSGVPTVTITRPDGTTIASGTVTKVSATTGIYEFTLAPLSECTLLMVTWAGPIGGVTQTITTYVEVLGALLFTVPEFRALRVAGSTPFSSSATPLFSDTQIQDARAATLDEFDQILGFAPVPRFRRETLDGDGSTCLELPGLRAHRVLSVTVNGTAQTATNYQVGWGNMLEAVTSYGTGTAFTVGRRNVVVEWVAGWERLVGKGGNIAMLHAASVLLPGMSSSASTVITPDGTSYSYDPAGQVTAAGTVRHTGIPTIDAWLNRHAQPGAMAAR